MGKTRWKSFNWRVKSPNIDKNSGMSNLNFSLTGKIPYLSPLPPIPKVGPRDPKKVLNGVKIKMIRWAYTLKTKVDIKHK